jgi:hypothetical protein
MFLTAANHLLFFRQHNGLLQVKIKYFPEIINWSMFVMEKTVVSLR